MRMKNILRLEEAALFGISVYALTRFDAAWWWYLLLFLGPDISMIGYLGGNKTGAFWYNLFHHKGVAAVIFLTGWLVPDDTLLLTGLILFGHSCMDRALGYGLKTPEGFKHTHLGMIGK